MDKLKNLTIMQMALILGGALFLRKVLNTKVAIVGKNESDTDSVLSALVPNENADLINEFETVKSDTVLPLMASQTLEIKTPFNSPEMQENQVINNYNNAVTPFTNEYFK